MGVIEPKVSTWILGRKNIGGISNRRVSGRKGRLLESLSPISRDQYYECTGSLPVLGKKEKTVREMWNQWLERFVFYMHKRNFSEKTVKDYFFHLRFFFLYLEEEGIETISQVTKEVLHRYQTYLYYYERKGSKLSFATQRSKLGVVRAFFRFLVKEDYFPYDPTVDIELPRRKKNLPSGIMSVKEVFRVLEAPKGDDPLTLRDRAILETLYSTGIRNKEIRSLTIFDADLSHHQLRITDGKGMKERIVPLGECASMHINRYLKEGRPHLVKDPSCTILFLSTKGNRMDPGSFIWMVKKYIKRAKINKYVTPHCFRHTCATHMLKGKADLRHVQELLGHSSVHTTQIYTRVELSNLKEVHSRCHPRERKRFTR